MIAEREKNIIKSFFLKPFPLLDDYKSKLFLVLFSGLFSSFFIYFYNPFNLQSVKYDSAIGSLLSIWSAGVLGAMILTLTQFVLRPLANLKTFKMGQFFLWVVFEFLFLCLGIFFIFGESTESLLGELSLIAKYTVSLGLLPYIIACLLIAVVKLSVGGGISPAQKSSKISEKQLMITDENGKFMLAIKPIQLLFLKSEDNYTSVHYLQNGKVERKLIRTNLKKLEGELDYLELMRIHRSYMINLAHVVSVQRKKSDFQIQLEHLPDLSLKVSETYKRSFEEKLKKRI